MVLDLPSNVVLHPGGLLELPLDVVGALTGHRLRIAGQAMPLIPLEVGVDGDLLGVAVPADLKPGSEVEVALVDALGCRSWRTVMATVGEPASSCGLLGIELAVVWPLARRLARRRRS
jgi:hypothetical protein